MSDKGYVQLGNVQKYDFTHDLKDIGESVEKMYKIEMIKQLAEYIVNDEELSNMIFGVVKNEKMLEIRMMLTLITTKKLREYQEMEEKCKGVAAYDRQPKHSQDTHQEVS